LFQLKIPVRRTQFEEARKGTNRGLDEGKNEDHSFGKTKKKKAGANGERIVSNSLRQARKKVLKA